MKLKPFTKKERLAIYKIALQMLSEDIENKENPSDTLGGFCSYINRASQSYCENHLAVSFRHFRDDSEYDYLFPEISAYRPSKDEYVRGVLNTNPVFWFSQLRGDGGIKRLQILENVIAEMEKKKRKIVTFKVVLTYK